MARTAKQAIDWAMKTTTGYAGLCLQFTRLAYGIPAKYPSAISAWKNGKQHKTSKTSEIPVGAPIFFSGSKYGHIAIYLGDGLMRTTNSGTNRIHTSTVASWLKVGYKLEGWSDELNGVKIAGLKAPSKPSEDSVDTKKLVLLNTKGDRAAIVKTRLRTWYPKYAKHLSRTNVFDKESVEALKEFQRRSGLKVDGVAGPESFKAMGLKW